MTPFVIRPHLSEPTFTKTLALNGVADEEETNSTVGDIYWRWEDEPESKQQYLGKAVAGHSLKVPFDLQNRPIRLFLVSRTEDGLKSVANITESEQLVFTPSTAPVLADLVFDPTPDEVEGTIAENQGTGTIRILRQLGSDEFFEIDSVPSGTTNFIDEPILDGTYTYKLTQDGQTGESNSRSAVVSGVGSPAGSPPTALTGTFDGVDTVTLNWTNNGGTGANKIEERIGSGGIWAEVDSVASGTSTTDVGVVRGSSHQTYYYRIRNESVAGYSNEESVFVPKEV